MIWHAYFVLNGALASAFIIARLTLSIAYFKKRILQIDRLRLARSSFLIAAFAFLMIPYILVAFPSSCYSHFQLEPIFKNASDIFLNQSLVVNEAIKQRVSYHSFFSFYLLLELGFFIGSMFFLGKYIKSILYLKKIQKNAFHQHTINNIQILFSQEITIPCCWSLVKNHFIVIPNRYLEKTQELKLVIRHELQHIRQKDTYWLHFLMLIKSFCFWNPFMKLWINWLNELQEFSCDESIVLRKKIPPIVYAECLLNAAKEPFTKEVLPMSALGMQGSSHSILFRRVNMLFHYNKSKMATIAIVCAYLISFFGVVTAAYAVNGSVNTNPFSTNEVIAIIDQSHLDPQFHVSATPEVVNELNHIRSSEQARSFMRDSLKRMKDYQPFIEASLKKASMPTDLLVLPLIESGYKPLDQNKNPVQAAGIWQIIPETGKVFGLIINHEQDDRLNTELSTKAALTYLKSTHAQFKDWKLAVIAYEIGENKTNALIKQTNSEDAWVLARSSNAPQDLNKFVTRFDTALIIMHNPSLVR